MGNCFGSKSTSSKKNNNNNKKGKDIKNVAAVKREQEALSAAPSLQNSNGSNINASNGPAGADSMKKKEKGQPSKNEMPGFSKMKLEALFNKYKEADVEEEDEEHIGPNGIEKFCNDLEVDPTDVVLLVLSWHLNAQEMAYYYKDEFMKGLEKLKLDSLEGIKQRLVSMRRELEDPQTLKSVYLYVFDFAKSDDKQKCIENDIATGLLNLLLVEKYFHAKNFVEFLSGQQSVKGLNMDQWRSLLEFCQTIKDDLSNYDENGAWPCVMDEYVQWLNNGKQFEEEVAF